MKILMQNRATTFSWVGGDTIQMLKTKEYLEKLNIKVDISLDTNPDLREYDLVHVFNIQECAAYHSHMQIINAKKRGMPVALSPIYWQYDRSEVSNFKKGFNQSHGASKFYTKIYLAAITDSLTGIASKIVLKLLNSIRSEMEYLIVKKESDFIKYLQVSSLLLTDVLLPNANQELEIIMKNFDIKFKNVFIVPNAVDKKFKDIKRSGLSNDYGGKDYILCVGRIQSQKNQLNLLRAMKGINIPIVFIGKKNLNYFELCRKIASENVHFLDVMDHDQLFDYYTQAKVHVLPSWRETPGLVNLEAGLSGCNLVVTDRGSTKEYFKDFVWYCNPADMLSIRDAVLEAYNSPRDNKLSEYILENFTWEKTAEETLKGYKLILNR